jgi:hypothetical protein
VPTLTASDVIAIVAIVAGVFGTLAGGMLADRRAERRAKAERLLQARLRAIEDTQRYVGSMLDFISTVGLIGRAEAGQPPHPGDYPKVAISIIGNPAVVMLFSDYVLREGRRAQADGPRWTPGEAAEWEHVGIAVTRALRTQEDLVLSGKQPIIAPADQQERDTLAWLDRREAESTSTRRD